MSWSTLSPYCTLITHTGSLIYFYTYYVFTGIYFVVIPESNFDGLNGGRTDISMEGRTHGRKDGMTTERKPTVIWDLLVLHYLLGEFNETDLHFWYKLNPFKLRVRLKGHRQTEQNQIRALLLEPSDLVPLCLLIEKISKNLYVIEIHTYCNRLTWYMIWKIPK